MAIFKQYVMVSRLGVGSEKVRTHLVPIYPHSLSRKKVGPEMKLSFTMKLKAQGVLALLTSSVC
jgi:hypothetical protein